MAMDQQRPRQQYWSLWVEGDKEQTVAPGPNERLCVTGAFLVGGQGAADVCAVINSSCGADCVPLASLSAANPCVETSVVVYQGEECSLFVMPQGGPAVVRFDGYVAALPPPAKKEGEAVTPVDNVGDWYVRLESGDKESFTPRADAPICVTAVFLPDPADADRGAVDAYVVMGTGHSLLLASLSEKAPRVELRPPVVLDQKFSFSATGPRPPGIVQFEGYILAPSAPEGQKEGDEDDEAGSSKLDHDSRDDGEVEGLAAVSESDDDEKEEETSSSEDDEGYEDEEEEEEASSSEDDEGYEDEEEEEEASSSEDHEGYQEEEEEEEEESDGDVGGHAATESSAGGGNTLLRRRCRNFVPEALGRPLGVLAPPFAFDRELVQQVAAGALIGLCVFVYVVAFFKVMISIHLST